MREYLKMKLVKPTSEYKASYIEALKEGFYVGVQSDKTPSEIERINQNFEQYLEEMDNSTGKIICEDGKEYDIVPQSTYWLIDNNIFIGSISLRKKLNQFLVNFGGNIGYGVRPSMQKKGYASKMLGLLLQDLKSSKLKEVLLTCSPKNIGSNKVIQNNGGEFLGAKDLEWREEPTNHYKIKLK